MEGTAERHDDRGAVRERLAAGDGAIDVDERVALARPILRGIYRGAAIDEVAGQLDVILALNLRLSGRRYGQQRRSEEHTSELQSLMRISYAVFCLKKITNKKYRN